MVPLSFQHPACEASEIHPASPTLHSADLGGGSSPYDPNPPNPLLMARVRQIQKNFSPQKKNGSLGMFLLSLGKVRNIKGFVKTSKPSKGALGGAFKHTSNFFFFLDLEGSNEFKDVQTVSAKLDIIA